MTTLNEKTRISLPVKAIYTLAICFAGATFWLAGIYAESRDALKYISESQERINKLEAQNAMICRVLKRIQDSTVPVIWREDMKCN